MASIDWKDWKNYIALLLPLASGFLTGFLCKMDKNAGISVPARPP